MSALLPDRDALTVAMALVPGMYARNKLFSLHRDPEVRRARARAATIRGVVRQLAGERGPPEEIALVRHGEVSVLRFRLRQVSFERRVELTDVERACLVFLAARAGVHGLHPSAEEREILDAALKRLGAELPAMSAAAPGGRLQQSDFPPR